MKMKKLFAFATTMFLLGLQVLPATVLSASVAAAQEAEEVVEEVEYYIGTFIISAYYSPLPNQERYVTGSYAGDIRLNGNGTNGADGTEVYPGMIAAPSKYPFGTKMEIPGVGTVAVHDRGGAILVTGERGYAYDRLDIWMGFGDAGLVRALNWGKRTLDVTVYGINPNVPENVYLEGYSAAEAFVRNTVLSPLEFPADLYAGDNGDEIKKMQEWLKEWGYFDNEPSGYYDDDTVQAIFKFQLDFDIVESEYDLGAGHFGISTRGQFDKLINMDGDVAELIRLEKGQTLLVKYPDLFEEKSSFYSALELGDSGEAVRALQRELTWLGFYRMEITGYFGETTEHALFKFQQSQGIVTGKDELGAGYLGPNTRNALNAILADRYEMKSYIAYERSELEESRHFVNLPEKSELALRSDED